jgi:hypothetical protein
MSSELTKEKSKNDKLRDKLREGARLGSTSLLGGIGGGVISGFVEAKYPVFAGTGIRTAGALGTLLVATSLIGWLKEYSDEAAALGSGLIAASVSREAERYFSS